MNSRTARAIDSWLSRDLTPRHALFQGVPCAPHDHRVLILPHPPLLCLLHIEDQFKSVLIGLNARLLCPKLLLTAQSLTSGGAVWGCGARGWPPSSCASGCLRTTPKVKKDVSLKALLGYWRNSGAQPWPVWRRPHDRRRSRCGSLPAARRLLRGCRRG